jgi:hypothetical protein
MQGKNSYLNREKEEFIKIDFEPPNRVALIPPLNFEWNGVG